MNETIFAAQDKLGALDGNADVDVISSESGHRQDCGENV